eukprot:COSAG02_NODE_1752_length_11064_cov_16.303785_2_plen_1006_part_00
MPPAPPAPAAAAESVVVEEIQGNADGKADGPSPPRWECAWCTDFAPREERAKGPDGSETLCRACGSSFGCGSHAEGEEGSSVGRAIDTIIGKSGLRLQPAVRAAEPEPEPEPELGGSAAVDSDGWECSWCTEWEEAPDRCHGPDGPCTLCRTCAAEIDAPNQDHGPSLTAEQAINLVAPDVEAIVNRVSREVQARVAERQLQNEATRGAVWRCERCEAGDSDTEEHHEGPSGPGSLCGACAHRYQGNSARPPSAQPSSLNSPDAAQVSEGAAELGSQNGPAVAHASLPSALDAKVRLLELSETAGNAPMMSPTESEAAADRLLGLESGAKVNSEPSRAAKPRRTPPRLPGNGSPMRSDLSLRAADAASGVARRGSSSPASAHDADARPVSPALAAAAARFHSPYRSARGKPARKQTFRADSPGRALEASVTGGEAGSSPLLSLSIASVAAAKDPASVGNSDSPLSMASIVTQLTAIQAADRWLAQSDITPKSELLDKLATPKRVKSPPVARPSPAPPRRGDESAGAVFDRLSAEMTAAIKEKLPGEVKKEKKRQDKQKEKQGKTRAAAAHQKKMDQVTKRMTDPSQYVGVHKHRFDEQGKGKGLEGRLDVADVMQRVGNSVMGRTESSVEKLAEKVLEDHQVSQLDTVPPKPKPRRGICRVCKLPLQSTTATVHASCKKTQASDIAGVAERLYSKPARDDAVYEAKLRKKQEEAEKELAQKHLAEAKRRHKPISQEQSIMFVERQEMTREANQQKLEEKRKREDAQTGAHTFSPQLNPASIKMASAQPRVGTAFDRQYAWAVATQMKSQKRLKEQQLQDLTEHHVKSPRLLEVARAELQEAMSAYDEAKSALRELSPAPVKHCREPSEVSKIDGAASGSDVDGNMAVPEPQADPELVAGLAKEVSADDAEESAINWARAYVDLPPDGADPANAEPGTVSCEADREQTSASAEDSDGHRQQVEAEGADEEDVSPSTENQEVSSSPTLPSAAGMVRRRGGKAVRGQQ